MSIMGFYYFDNFLSEAEEKNLLKKFSAMTWDQVNMCGVIAKRHVKHYGMDYTYNSRTISPTIKPPKYIHDLIQRAAALMEINENEIAEVLLTEYPIGAGIGWHRDAKIFGDKVFGISLGNKCIMKFRNKEMPENIIKQILQPRSAYILSGEARWNWEHSIPSVTAVRYSITFRTLR